ncbi:hypothetical protein C8J56DRAFT_1042359 [Mycena floridula]|nr:hypothetical protein C8J56DRAFT_1042359 [Mycena floridula]
MQPTLINIPSSSAEASSRTTDPRWLLRHERTVVYRPHISPSSTSSPQQNVHNLTRMLQEQTRAVLYLDDRVETIQGNSRTEIGSLRDEIQTLQQDGRPSDSNGLFAARTPQYARSSAFDVQRSPEVICRQGRLHSCQEPSSVGSDQAVANARDAQAEANAKLEAKVKKPVDSGRGSHESILVDEHALNDSD